MEIMPKTKDPIFDTLNAEQQRAVEHTRGPILILAGAGSGKTRALTHRIARLIEEGVPPWQILAGTFTNKAANEMKSRIRNLLHITDPGPFDSPFGLAQGDRQSRLPVMGTFHSVCARILRRDIERLGRDRRFVIYDTDDQEKLMKEVLHSMHVDDSELKPRAALGYVGRFKCEALGPKEAEAQATSARMQKIAQAYRSYEAALRRSNALDFDDLILETVRLFVEHQDVLDRYQETWRFLNVDEYQDTNHAQYLMMTLLARKYRNLCVIGDPDQSIYAFRGADIRNILEFEKEYPDAARIKLERNYRSTQLILTAANGVIRENPNRPEKEMWTERTEGPKCIVHEVRDEGAEAAENVRKAEELKKSGLPWNEQVILYRTNAQSRLFEEACMRAGIPYRIVGGFKFYARKEVKDIIAYLYVLLNPQDTISLFRILNVPARKIGATTIGRLQELSSEHTLTLWESLQRAGCVKEIAGPTRERIARFVELIRKYQALSHEVSVSKLAVNLITEIGLEKWLRDDTPEGEERWENVQELLTVMQKYDELEPDVSLTSFLEEVALISEVDKLTDVRDDALTLMTLHLCKGLEFESVTIAGCEEGLLPHSSSLFDREQLEEERRLLYVGMTRAKTHLTMTFTRSRHLWGSFQENAPSRFLEDLPEEVIERRSDDVLSAFAWAAARGLKGTVPGGPEGGTGTVPRAESFDVDFNQDLDFTGERSKSLSEGTRVHHPSFGAGTIVARRGDVADVEFDSGQRKRFALSIAPLRPL